MPYLRHLTVLGVAEPFWNDALFHVLEMLNFKEHKWHIRLETNTNVLCLCREIVERFFAEVEHSDLAFSIDAARSQTYEKIRRWDVYTTVIEKVKAYIAHRNMIDPQHTRHTAGIYNNINLINVDEMPAMVDVAKDCGVDWMIMLPTHDQSGRAPLGELLINKKNEKMFRRYADQAMDRAKEVGLRLQYPVPFVAKS